MLHHLIKGFLKEDQLEEYETKKASGKYEDYKILGKMELVQNISDLHLKESHFWDNFRCVGNFTFDKLTRRCTPELIIRSHLKYQDAKRDYSNEEDLRDIVYIDSTPRMATGHFSWNEEEVHWGKREPDEFISDRLHHVIPNAKIIFMMREPVSRTFSDYRFISKERQDATDFHEKIVNAINWWKNCTKLYKFHKKVCAYGNAPFDLPMHSSQSCGLRGAINTRYCTPFRPWGCANCIDRMRSSIYHIYITEWLRVFPRENILFLKIEDILQDKISVLNKVLEFSGLPLFKSETVEYILQRAPKNRSKMQIQMLNETKDILEEFFAPMNQALSDLLEGDYYV